MPKKEREVKVTGFIPNGDGQQPEAGSKSYLQALLLPHSLTCLMLHAVLLRRPLRSPCLV